MQLQRYDFFCYPTNPKRHKASNASVEGRKEITFIDSTRTDDKDRKKKRRETSIVRQLCHKSYLVNMTGTSYRIKETKKYISNK